MNDVSIEELQSVLKVHKAFVKSRYGSGDGQEAYVDAGDLGADPETYAKSNGIDAKSLKRNGINGHDVKRAAVAAGGVPIDGSGVVANGVSTYAQAIGVELITRADQWERDSCLLSRNGKREGRLM